MINCVKRYYLYLYLIQRLIVLFSLLFGKRNIKRGFKYILYIFHELIFSSEEYNIIFLIITKNKLFFILQQKLIGQVLSCELESYLLKSSKSQHGILTIEHSLNRVIILLSVINAIFKTCLLFRLNRETHWCCTSVFKSHFLIFIFSR